ncbi:MAG TPA: hypothetical protein VNO21_24535 [Polyangiaceae bacterium]|nr:hypothetical protein [Polyangiaceae bacterium]
MIHVTVTAKNEERAIGDCLKSLRAAIAFAEARVSERIALEVVLDECTDGTEAIARAHGAGCVVSAGGKVEAQRSGLRPGPFQVFSDADILVSEETILALCEAMFEGPEVKVAFPPKVPLPPRRSSPLAHALHVYNLRRGFSSQRTWFSGKLFAIRGWHIPTRAEVVRRMCEESAFYNFSAGMRVDDIYLSRMAWLEGGAGAVRETVRGQVQFRAPETWLGMYRYYRRMRMELERVDILFPETRHVHHRFGARKPDLLVHASASEKRVWTVFQAALGACRVAYRMERAYYERLALGVCDPWPAIQETKDLG